MMPSRKLLLACAVASLFVVASTGCRRKQHSTNTTTVVGGDDDIFTTDTFPGSSVQDGNVADDARAFSASGVDVNPGTLMVTTNGDRGTAMATYAATALSGPGTFLYAQHFDGVTWTPPVQLEALDVNFIPGTGSAPAATVHAFINTADHASDLARERDGDCLIVWRWDDLAGVGSDGVNQALFVTYFDVTLRDSVADRHGFQEVATRIDAQDEIDEDVFAFGVLTDGICGEARWIDGARTYSYGDATTRIAVFYRQCENNDVDAAVEDRGLYVVDFPLDQPGDPALRIAPASPVRVSSVNYGYSDAGVTSHETVIQPNFVSYNNLLGFGMIGVVGGNPAPDLITDYRFSIATEFLAETDLTMQVAALNLATGALNPTTLLRTAPIAAGDALRNHAQFPHSATFLQGGRSMYGSDEGLATAIAIFGEQINVVALFDHRSSTWRMAEIDEVDGSLTSVGSFSVSDPDEDDGAFADSLSTVLSRNGDVLWLIWTQAADTTAGIGNDFGTFGVFAVQYTTTRLNDDGSSPVIPPTSGTLSSPILLGAPTPVAPVAWFSPQASLGYVCGSQSDPDVINVFFEMSDALGDTVWSAELTADLVGAPTPGAVVSVFEGFEEGDQAPVGGFNPGPQPGFNSAEGQSATSIVPVRFMAVDGGADGNVLAAYVDDVDTTPTDDLRVFSERTGLFSAGTVEIGSNDPAKTTNSAPILWVQATPPGNDIGSFDPISLEDSRVGVAAERVQILFAEPETSDVDGLGFALRTRAFLTDDNGETFPANFRPSAGLPLLRPFDLDVPGLNPPPVTAPSLLAVVRSGNNTGAFFSEDGHLYYQEWFDGNLDGPNEVAWNHVDSEVDLGLPASNPFLLDDDSETKVTVFEGVFTRSCVCDRIEGAMIFWSKRLDNSSSDKRLQVRVRQDQ